MSEGRIVKWVKKEGEKVRPGDVMFEVETDKATMECEATEEFVIGKIIVQSGGNMLPVGATIAYAVDDASHYKDSDYPNPSKISASPPTPAAAPPQPSSPPKSSLDSFEGRMWPSVRRLLEEHHLDPKSIKATGPKGVLLKGDILNALSSPSTTPPPPSPSFINNYTEIPNNNIRKVIAKRLSESKSMVPHIYIARECPIDAVLSLRSKLNAAADSKVKLSVNDFIIKASALALRDVPSLNVYFSNKSDDIIQRQSSVDISVAVATDRGLITPIVKSADSKSLSTISETVKSLAAKARDGKLKPDEFQGGSFSISNLGMFGISGFSAVINPPQACIMAIGEGKKKVDIESLDPSSDLKFTTVIEATLSCDARVVSDEDAATFLQVFSNYLEKPETMI